MTRVTPNTLTPLNYLRQAPRLTRQKPLRPITSETKRWAPDLDIVSPIASKPIPGFRAWVNWNGYKNTWGERWWRFEHTAVDFAAFVNNKDQVVLGLPPETEVRAVADGVVSEVRVVGGEVGHPFYDEKLIHPYFSHVGLNHGGPKGLQSEYHHIIPAVEPGQVVQQGEAIGTLYKDPGTRRGRLIHLHFAMRDAIDAWIEIDPAKVYPELFPLTADPFGKHRFRLLETGFQPDLVIANFRKITTRTRG